MIKKLIEVGRRSIGLDIPGRNLHVLPDDIFIVSYPRSGNTWTRFLIANLLHQQAPVTFANIETVIPDLYAHSRRFFRNLTRPRVIKSHEYFDPRYPRVIYIVRDPRDSAVSSYFFHKKQGQIADDLSISEYVKLFVTGQVWSKYASWGENVASWLSTRPAVGSGLFGSWGEHVRTWLEAGADSGTMLLVRYESLLDNTEAELQRIAAFVGIRADSRRIARAVELSSARSMQALERKESDQWYLTKNTRKDISFVRSAKSGGWRDSLPPESIHELEQAWAHVMTPLGYELTTAPCRVESS